MNYPGCLPVADPGGVPRSHAPPSPVQISHKEDGRQRRSHGFHVSCPPPPGRCDPMLSTHLICYCCICLILDVDRDPMGVCLICNAPGFNFNLYGLHETLLDTQTYPSTFFVALKVGEAYSILSYPQGSQCLHMRYPECG